MAHSEDHPSRLKVVRVVTASYVVPWHLANTLQRMPKDFEVTVVGQGVSAYREDYPDIRWIDLELNRKVSVLSDLRALYALCRIFISIKPDIVHSIMPKSGMLTAIAGFLCRVPVRLHTFTGQIWATKQGMARRFYYLIDRLINALNTTCLTDSPSQSAFLREHGITHEGGALPVLSKGSLSGVDTERFRPDGLVRARIRSELGIPKAAIVFLFLGRMNRDKGVLDLVRAFASLNAEGAHLVLSGPDEEGIDFAARTLAATCMGRVHLTGAVSRPEDYMAMADVFCLPSYREGFGSVVIEAAACGLPAIGSRIPGLVDAIEDGCTGVLFPQGDGDALAGIMRDFLEHAEKHETMGVNAKIRVAESFGAEVLYEALKSLYTSIADKRGAKGAQ